MATVVLRRTNSGEAESAMYFPEAVEHKRTYFLGRQKGPSLNFLARNHLEYPPDSLYSHRQIYPLPHQAQSHLSAHPCNSSDRRIKAW